MRNKDKRWLVVNLKTNELNYTNGKLYKIIELKGEPVFNNDKIYIKHNKSYTGGLYNLNYLATTPKIQQVRLLYQNKPVVD